MRTLYPPVEPYVRHTLQVEAPHTLYVEECGNPAGIPVLFVHGGPGGGCEPWHRQFFDPDRYRIVLFDQRGCGRSTPHASLENNTTQALTGDMEQLREHLGIERWMLFGGSWGSTLSLLYAQACPERVLALVLRGIFLCRKQDIDWFYQQGASRLFPDAWQDFIAPVPPSRRDNLVQAYHELLTGDDEVRRLAAARAWSVWEGTTSTLQHKPALVRHFADSYIALSMARIECHYFINGAFIRPDQIISDAAQLKNIPGRIIHGRYDVVCPVDQAIELHHAWPEADVQIIPASGHSAGEPAVAGALLEATDHFAGQLA
ncbi:prolyl aminopeptidase [Thiogranum longum]|uniref:Proline iminopeptidase n=1 Tax=Thiogranum longum TaxID=1537524 RepID=A0A4R1HGM9_9GAMM|nr:prolyl aminopeptidase [Thiogranum longum]TCK19575.1 prolyl aminopeptidase [Thiogranum longum]